MREFVDRARGPIPETYWQFSGTPHPERPRRTKRRPRWPYWQSASTHCPPTQDQCAQLVPPSAHSSQIDGSGPVQSAAVVQPADTHVHCELSNTSPAGQGMGSHTGQVPVTRVSQPPPHVVDDGQPSAGLWQLNPAPPSTSVQLYSCQPDGQQVRGGSHVPPTSGPLDWQTRPAPH